MRRLTTLLVLCVVVSSGTAAAQGEAASGGWHNVFGPFIVQAGHSTTFTLGRAAHPLCFEGACLGDNPRVRWGDGQESDLQHQDCATGGLNPMGCLLVGTHTYANPGVYYMQVSYNSTCCLSYSAFTSVIVDPDVGQFIHTPIPLERFSIVSVGDSVASGEGNPQVNAGVTGLGLNAVWADGLGPPWWDINGEDDSACHRSFNSGPVLAKDAIQILNPTTTVDFTHLACSGANSGGVVGQIQDVANRPADQSIDALLMSVGANDGVWGPDPGTGELVDSGVGSFSSVVYSCLGDDDCSTDETLGLEGVLESKFAALPARYAVVAAAIDALPNPVADTYITQYYDPTRDHSGRVGGPITINCTVNTIAPVEWQFLFNHQVAPLNRAVRDAAVRHGWHLVDGIQEGFVNHGYCAGAQAWVVTAQESLANQFDVYGTAHPNLSGQHYYANRIARTIFKRTTPRVFFQPVTIFGEAVSPGEWVNQDVTVDIEARNLALAGAIRMDWSVYRDDGTTLQVRGSGTTLENVIDDGSCDVLGSAGPVPCRSELRTQVSFSEEGQHLVSVTSDNAWGRRSRETHVAVNIDKTPPTVDFGDADPPPNAAGWHLGEVRVPYGVYDALSGVDGPGNGVVTVNSEAPVRLTVSDFASNSRTYDVPVRLDLTPPTTRCEVLPSVIWPPNGRLVPVTVAVGVDDALSGPAGFVLTSVTSSEPGAADDIQGFVPGTPSTSGWLRARRLGNGSGRVFTFTYTGIDVAGNTSNCVAEVTIRHDSGR